MASDEPQLGLIIHPIANAVYGFLVSVHPEMALFHNLSVNLRDWLCDVAGYVSPQSLSIRCLKNFERDTTWKYTKDFDVSACSTYNKSTYQNPYEEVFSQMPFLFIGTTGDQAGQSLTAWAVAKRLFDKGLSVGFFKPRMTTPVQLDGFFTDSDAFLFKQVFDIPDPIEKICPSLLYEQASHYQVHHKELINEIRSFATEAAAGKDVLLIVGAKQIFFDDAPHSLSDVLLISEMKADLVLVHRFKKISSTIYSLLSIVSLLREQIKGIIINRVPPEAVSELKDQILPILHEKGISSVAVLPEDDAFSFKDVGRINRILKGRILCGREFLERPVVGMTVGAGVLKGGLRIFKRVYNKIILLGPGEPGQEVAGIILTGNRKPADQVLEAAKTSNIPLILVGEDGFGVKERLEHGTPSLTPADESKMLHFTAMMDREDFLNGIIRSLGLEKMQPG